MTATAAEVVQQRRDFPSAPSHDQAPSGRKRRAGRTGRGSSAAALGQLPTAWPLGAGACQDTGRRNPAPNPGGAWSCGKRTRLSVPRPPRPVPGAVPFGLAPQAPPLSAGPVVALWPGKLIIAAQ